MQADRPTLLDRLRAHHSGTDAERMAPTLVEGLPVCDQEGCPLYDGKRCDAQGCRPESLCEPAVEAMAALNRALVLVVERLEANATTREGVMRRERELWRTAERERDALRDAVQAAIDHRCGPAPWHPPDALAAWAALRAAMTPTPKETT